MKKLVSICFVCMWITFAAGAANVGTIDNGYPGDTEAQAQMLYDLGLFRGTEKGFELDKPMTRAEAAAMLTRLLGAEQEVQTGEWAHPFSDVPQWADNYIGWLYEKGLTKGISATRYGAEQNVTCGQYCTFLARASTDSDDYAFLLRYGENEEERCDMAGFVRGDAVSLSVRLLQEGTYRKNGNTEGKTVAQVLVDKGVFTADQLGEAARDVLSLDYYVSGEGAETEVQRVIAGVVVSACEVGEQAGLRTQNGNEEPIYLVTGGNAEDQTLCRVEWDERKLIPLYTCGSEASIDALCRIGRTDYFYISEWPENQPNRTTVLMIQGDAVQLTDITLEGDWELQPQDNGQLLLGETGWLLTESGVQPAQMCGVVFAKLEDGRIVTQSIDTEQTTIYVWTADGQPVNAITVDNDVLAYPSDDARIAFAPQLINQDNEYFWGSAGLYRMDAGGLTQITPLPTYDYARSPTDGSVVIVTHDPNRFVAYSESAITMRTGDTLVRILPDGTAEPLLPELPEGSLLLDRVDFLADGRVEFTTLKSTEPRMMGRFTCVLDDGKVTVTDATDDIFYMWGADAIAVEQARLDALGIGSGAA